MPGTYSSHSFFFLILQPFKYFKPSTFASVHHSHLLPGLTTELEAVVLYGSFRKTPKYGGILFSFSFFFLSVLECGSMARAPAAILGHRAVQGNGSQSQQSEKIEESSVSHCRSTKSALHCGFIFFNKKETYLYLFFMFQLCAARII